MTELSEIPPGYTAYDFQKLAALTGPQKCESCGQEIPVESADVVDHEVTCLDCVATYYQAVYEARTGDA